MSWQVALERGWRYDTIGAAAAFAGLIQHLGFGSAFGAFAAVAAVGAVLFVGLMPETRPVPEAGAVGG